MTHIDYLAGAIGAGLSGAVPPSVPLGLDGRVSAEHTISGAALAAVAAGIPGDTTAGDSDPVASGAAGPPLFSSQSVAGIAVPRFDTYLRAQHGFK